jgi:hypothetical protein
MKDLLSLVGAALAEGLFWSFIAVTVLLLWAFVV